MTTVGKMYLAFRVTSDSPQNLDIYASNATSTILAVLTVFLSHDFEFEKEGLKINIVFISW